MSPSFMVLNNESGLSSSIHMTLGKQQHFDILVNKGDGDRRVGILEAKKLLRYQTDPGPHLFLARGENWSYLRADLKRNRSYYVSSRVFPWFLKTRSAFDPLEPGDTSSAEQLLRWLSELPARVYLPV